MKLQLILSLAILSLVFNSQESYADSSPYKIGIIAPLTGDYASLGQYVKKGVDLAYEKLSAKDRTKIQLFYEDDQLQNTKSVSALQKLVNSNKINAVFVVGSGVGNAVAPLAEKNKVLMVAIGASDKSFLVDKKFVFSHWISPEAEAKVMVQEIKKKNYQRLAVLTYEQEGTLAVEKAFIEQLESNSLKNLLVYQERVLGDVRDFRTIIAKLRNKKVDGVCSILVTGGLSSFAKQARDLNLQADLFGFELFEDESEVKASNGALIGKWYVNGDEPTAEFIKLYRDKYNEPPGIATANAFDSLSLVAEGYLKFGNDNLKIAEYLKTLKDYSGAAGVYSATGDNRFDLPVTVKIVTKEGFEKLQDK